MAVFRALGEGFIDDFGESGGDVVADLAEVDDFVVADGFEGFDVSGALEEAATGDEFPDDDADGEDVAFVGDEGGVDGAFGGDVGELAFDHAVGGLDVIGAGVGEAEVGDFDFAVAADEDVGGADIVVDEAEGGAVGAFDGVCVAEALADHGADEEGVGEGHGFLAFGEGFIDPFQIHPFNVFHHNKEGISALPDIVNADDIFVLELKSEASFVNEHLLEHLALFLDQLRQDALDSDLALQAADRVHPTEEDLGKAAATEGADEFVALVLLGAFLCKSHGYTKSQVRSGGEE